MMTWADMGKEQRQMLVLSVIIGFAALFALVRFALMPLMASFGTTQTQIEEISGDLENANRALELEPETRSRLEQSSQTLWKYNDRYLPARENPLTWATENAYRHARRVGVEVVSVAEVYAGQLPWKTGKKSKRYFIPYKVRLTARCGYYDLLRLIKDIEVGNPFVSIASIVVSAKDNPEQHTVNLTLEWPMWAGSDGPGTIRTAKDPVTKK